MIRFAKLHGIGNDFVFIDQITQHQTIVDAPALAKRICDRHKGVGADGLIFLERGDLAPFRMTMLNPDGSNGGMCGNGVRCAARLLVENGHQPLAPFTLEVEQRLLEVEPIRTDWIRVNMGMASLTRAEIGMMGVPSDTFISQAIEVRGEEFLGTAVSMGNPHLVILTDNLEAVDLSKLGPAFEHHPLFPFRTNVHFCEVVDSGHLKQRTWERGAGITLACGSGACSVGVAAFLAGGASRKVRIELPGGELGIEYLQSGDVLMEGSAERVFEGEWVADLVSA
jgi:diaminopimelate epimerase